MEDININFFVHCNRPGWAVNGDPKYKDLKYRIYVDNDLITERSWIWGDDIALHENIYVKFDTSEQHKLRIEPVLIISNQAQFEIHNPSSEGRRFVVLQRAEYNDLVFKIA